VESISEFRRQKTINESVPFDAALAFEPGGHHPDAIMSSPAFTRARVPRMTVGLVHNVERDGIERRRQLRDNSLLHDHR
jgi:hypothetical protein